ncbi:hypothetical protein pipiens_013002 [Culex pipiens pipiens]|uniref:Uncharacterized protein n=2 Tax=Culex pipiens TaxID=7175 RepID=A0ABD1D166_CULPP
MDTSTILTLLTFATALLFCPTRTDAAIAIQLERLEQIGGAHLADTSAIRVRKFNRTTFTLNGTFVVYQDLDETYEASLKVAYSRLGNNQWNEYPMKIGQKSVCRAMVEEYQQYQHVFVNSTNLPWVAEGTRSFCPFPKGAYWIHDLAPDASWVPPVVPAGYWRMTLDSWRNGELQGVFRVYLRLTK